VYGNISRDYLGTNDTTGINGNISSDPLFCSPADTVFSLFSNSPCLLGNHPDDSAGCGIIGALGMGCCIEAPYIRNVEDVLNDQGRQVSVSWYRSRYDSAGSDMTISNYEIYRRIDDLPMSRSALFLSTEAFGEDASGKDVLSYPDGDWHFVTEVPAHGEDVYSTVVPTLVPAVSSSTSTLRLIFKLISKSAVESFEKKDSYEIKSENTRFFEIIGC